MVTLNLINQLNLKEARVIMLTITDMVALQKSM